MPQQQPVRRARLAWALLGLTVVLLVSSVVIAFTGMQTLIREIRDHPGLAGLLGGRRALVAARTGNRLGWLFLAAAATVPSPCWRPGLCGPARDR